jgi:large subunit ribosomal protein L24
MKNKLTKKLKVGETVKVITGKDKGKSGKVVRILSEKNKVLVDGINMYKSHEKARKQGAKGQVVEKSMPIHISNVSLNK